MGGEEFPEETEIQNTIEKGKWTGLGQNPISERGQ